MIRTILVLILLAVIFGLVYIRFAPMPAATWHADPRDGARTGKPNDYLIGPGGQKEGLALSVPASEAMTRLDAAAMAEAGVSRLAGSPEELWVTYIQRSKVMGYPDAISVRVVPDGDGARLFIWSRSRFGHSDLGVNADRVTRWLAASGLTAG